MNWVLIDSIIGVIIVNGIVGYIASRRGKSFALYFFLSFIFTPIIMIVVAFIPSESDLSAITNKGPFAHPFNKDYWILSIAELKNVRMLVFASLMIALRVVLKSVSIPIAANLKIGIGFLVNAFGAMTFGPVVAILAAAVSDTLGCLLFPSGPYFFPFIFMEIAGSLIFALFLYRTKVTVTRIILSRFCIDFFVNIVLQTPVMYLYYQMMLGKNYEILNTTRIVKNLVMFPIESILLVFFLRLLVPPLKPLGIMRSNIDGLRFTRNNIITLVILFVIGAAAITLYVIYK